jgi:glycosyltransferase involved in cell wall biosynthesis
VLHVLEALTAGVSRHVVDLAGHVDGVRHVVAAPAHRVGSVPDRLARAQLAEAGAEFHRVEMRRSPLHVRNASSYVQLAWLVRRCRPAILHGHSAIGGTLIRLVPAPTGTVRVYTPHGLHESRFALAVERRLADRSDRVVAVSASEAALLKRHGIARDDNLVVIPNGVAAPAGGTVVDLRERAGIAPDAPLVGCVARLLPQKAPERFVECARLIAKADERAHFLLIGDGPLAAEVDRQADCAELRGRFVRLREVQGVAPSLGQLDVFVLLSRFEGAPYTPLEAAVAGTPVVLSDCVGNADVLGVDLASLVVRDGDPAAAAAVVTQLLADDVVRRQTGEACARHVRQAFGVETMGTHYRDLYLQLADVARSARR